jgi:hypothetical protein
LLSSGEDQISSLSFAACNDLVALKQTFGVDTTSTVALQKSNLIAAGLTIVNNHTAGLASSDSSINQQVLAALSTMINDPSYASASVTQVFVGICTGASTFGIGMRGF